jgi:hypothetical protein
LVLPYHGVAYRNALLFPHALVIDMTEISKEARRLLDRLRYYGTYNGATARFIITDKLAKTEIQSALDTAYQRGRDAGLEEAASRIEPQYDFEVISKRRKEYAALFRQLKGKP